MGMSVSIELCIENETNLDWVELGLGMSLCIEVLIENETDLDHGLGTLCFYGILIQQKNKAGLDGA